MKADVLERIVSAQQQQVPQPTKLFMPELMTLNPGQAKANFLLSQPQTHTCLVGGSRSGKTTLLVRRIVKRALQAPGSRHLIARFRANAVRASILSDTFPKLMRLAFPGIHWVRKQEGFVSIQPSEDDKDEELWPQIWFSGLDDEERIEKILGLEFATIFANECSQIPYSSILVLRTRLAQKVFTRKGRPLLLKAYYDLNPTTKAHWTNLEFGEKVSPLDGTKLNDPEEYERAFVNPTDNAANLDPKYLKSLANMPLATRIRFYDGKYVDAIEGALWTLDLLELCREDAIDPDPKGKRLNEFERIVVGVDPSGAQAKGDAKSAEIGIVAVGKRRGNSAVVLEDATMQGSPKEWGRAVVATFKKWKADLIVAEANYGGGMVEGTIKAVDGNVPVKLVNATRGKVVRAEPVAALYEHKDDELPKVTHAGRFNKLEEQLCLFAREGYKGERSPDRADAMVWALTDLMLNDDKYNGYTLAHVR